MTKNLLNFTFATISHSLLAFTFIFSLAVIISEMNMSRNYSADYMISNIERFKRFKIAHPKTNLTYLEYRDLTSDILSKFNVRAK